MDNQLPTQEQANNASKASSKSKEVLSKAKLAGCFHCTEIFPVSEIVEWVDDKDTALCPKCGVDSVLGDNQGYPLNKQSLEFIYKDRFN